MRRGIVMLTLTAVFAICSPAAAGEEVVVTFVDGKKQKGELIEQTLERVVLRTTIGKNNLDTPISWEKIQELSNGMTRELVHKKWKEANKEKLCDTCHGDRKLTCEKCKGVGKLAKEMVACTACKGIGEAQCKAKGCEAGKIPCTAPCLKLSEGKWEKGDENLLWRKFTYKGGWKTWSERHLGEVVEMQDGVPMNTGKCKLCEGSQKIACKACEGDGLIKCSACNGNKEVPKPGPAAKCPDCTDGKSACTPCKGTGLKQ